MKNYNQFINEEYAKGEFNKILPIGFKFGIDFSDAKSEQITKFTNELKNYFYFKDNDIFTFSFNITKPWGWLFVMSISGTGEIDIEYTPITRQKKYLDATFFEKFVTLDEFLMVGFEGIKSFIKMKKDADKYNM